MKNPNAKKIRHSQFKPGQSLVITNRVCGWLEGTVVTATTGEKLRDHKIEVRDDTGKTRKVPSKYLRA